MSYKTSLFFSWAEKGDYEGILSVVDTGIDLDTRNCDGDTALILASRGGHIEIAELLLARGADPNLQDKFGYTALMSASYRGYAEIVGMLLKRGADPNLQDDYEDTALIFASCKGHVGIVEILLKHGADPKLRDQTASKMAIREGHIEVANLLSESMKQF